MKQVLDCLPEPVKAVITRTTRIAVLQDTVRFARANYKKMQDMNMSKEVLDDQANTILLIEGELDVLYREKDSMMAGQLPQQ